METRYINQNRYKKVARNERKKRVALRSKKKKLPKVPIANNRLPGSENKKTRNSKKVKVIKKTWKIFFCIILILAIAAVSRLILKDEYSPFIPNIFEKKIVNEDNLRVGLIEEDLSKKYINNVVIQELDSYAYPMLLEINTNYEIEYRLISSIDKISNKKYRLNINNEYGISANKIKAQLEEYMSKDNIYYNYLKNIKGIEIEGNNILNVFLKTSDEYFIYNLALPIYIDSNILDYKLTTKTINKRVYTRRENADESLIKSITIIKSKSLDDLVEKYKNGTIDMLFGNSDRLIQLLGRYEYNVANYRDGNMLFLLGNKDSTLYSKKEIRNAICYGIDRDKIIEDIFKYNVKVIDLPYVYDEIKYKYDYIAAENMLLSSGYKKKKGIYSKMEDGKRIKTSLDLLVNKEDKEKIKVANYIKKDLYKIGIEINIEELSISKIKTRISKKDYDLVLADITLNRNPNISFLKNNTILSDIINLKNIQISNETVIDTDCMKSLQKTYSEEFCFTGIKANNIYVIYSKDFSNISNISYMNIFRSIMTQKIDSK